METPKQNRSVINTEGINTQKVWRIIFLILMDAIALNLAVFLALLLRFELNLNLLLKGGTHFFENAVKFAPLSTAFSKKCVPPFSSRLRLNAFL